MNAAQTMSLLVQYKSLQFARASYRRAGRKAPPMSQLRVDAKAFYDHPHVVEFAQRACAEFKSAAPKRRR
jgi:hypothetical protein